MKKMFTNEGLINVFELRLKEGMTKQEIKSIDFLKKIPEDQFDMCYLIVKEKLKKLGIRIKAKEEKKDYKRISIKISNELYNLLIHYGKNEYFKRKMPPYVVKDLLENSLLLQKFKKKEGNLNIN